MLLAALCTVVVVGNLSLVALHESAHQQIFRQYGVESRIEYSLYAIQTVPNGNYSLEDWRFASGLHAMNEVFGYQVQVLFNAQIAFFFMFCLILLSLRAKP